MKKLFSIFLLIGAFTGSLTGLAEEQEDVKVETNSDIGGGVSGG